MKKVNLTNTVAKAGFLVIFIMIGYLYGNQRPPLPYRSSNTKSEFRVYALENENNTDFWNHVRRGEIIVRFKKGIDLSSSRIASFLSKKGARVILSTNKVIIPYILVEITDDSKEGMISFIKEVMKDSRVLYAEPNLVVYPSYAPNDPYWGVQWGPWYIDTDIAWDQTFGNHNVKVFVLDEGIDYNHPDLQANYTNGYDFYDNDPDPIPTDTTEHHGTHVSGIVAATIDNGTGIAGMAQIQLWVGRVLGPGGGTAQMLVDGINWAVTNNGDIITMSLGGPTPSQVIEEACDSAWANGLLLVAATGNENADSINYPAAYASVIAVGAIDTTGLRADFSNYGPEIELAAPGVWIISTMGTWRPVPYDFMAGTSQATPHVTGVAALMKSLNPSLTNWDMRIIMDSTAYDLGAPGWDIYYGFGLVDADSALAMGIKEEVKNKSTIHFSFQFTPNPVKNQAFVQFSNAVSLPVNISIFDVCGRKIICKEVKYLQIPFSLDLSYLNSGVYFLQVKTPNGSSVKSFVKF